MEINSSLFGPYGTILAFIFQEWQESINMAKGKVSPMNKPLIESVFVKYFTLLLEPEMPIKGTSVDELSPYIQNSNVAKASYSYMESLTDTDDFMQYITNIAKEIVKLATKEELDYIEDSISKLSVACGSTQMFIPNMNQCNLGRDIQMYIMRYRRYLKK